MRTYRTASAVLLLAVASGIFATGAVRPALSADPPYNFNDSAKPQAKPEPTGDVIRGPLKHAAGSSLRLTADLWYVVDCKVDCIAYGSQNGTGRVKVTPETGPIRLRGRFADGDGKVETRPFDGPFVFIIEAESTGPVDLSVIPIGVKENKEIFRRQLDVSLNPIPPPPVPPGPTPVPPAPTPLPSDRLRVMMIYESQDTLTAAQSGVLRSTDIHKAIAAAVGEWRCWDKDVDSTAEDPFWQAAMKRERKSMPWVIISSPKGFWEGPLPSTVAAFIGLVKKYGA